MPAGSNWYDSECSFVYNTRAGCHKKLLYRRMTNRKRNIPGYNKSLQLTPKAPCGTVGSFGQSPSTWIRAAGQLNSMLHSPKLGALARVHFKKGRNRIEPITKNMKRRGPIFYYHWRY